MRELSSVIAASVMLFIALPRTHAFNVTSQQVDAQGLNRPTLSVPAASPTSQARFWTTRDIVEVSRIIGIAIRGATDVTAFIVERPSVAAGLNHYHLLMTDLQHPGRPRELLEAQYLADIAWRPNTGHWTVRADFGSGVQLYEITDDGGKTPLVVTPTTALVGGSDGLVSDSVESPRQTGVLSYEWSADGRRLWYSRLRFREAAAQRELGDGGLRYEDSSMFAVTMRAVDRAIQLLGTELRVFDPATKSDRVIAFAPADEVGGGDADVFRRGRGTAIWVGARDIQYWVHGGSAGYLRASMHRVNVDTGVTMALTALTREQIFQSAPTHAGILTVTSAGARKHLVDLSGDGRVVTDYGAVEFSDVAGSLGAWRAVSGHRIVLGVRFGDREGLVVVGQHARPVELTSSDYSLSVCAFNTDLSFGACSRESITMAPELVGIRLATRTVDVLARPNASYAQIAPLRTVAERWVNRFGYSNTGYVTYPRQYSAGEKYPAIVVTHSGDARNRFACDEFQWEFPIQAFAERGYFVLSVNEPTPDSSVPPPYVQGAAEVGVQREQFHQAYNPLASMEAATQALIGRGIVDPAKVGIAGYSRGASISRFAISHSALFTAASSGDASWWDAGGFWEGGELARNLYTNLLGGAPFDRASFETYLAFSASARAREFAGPLLQQFTSADAQEALEMDQLLKYARIPTELYIFPLESHLLWQPRHRMAAMEQNLDWFDFWLLGRRDTDPRKAAQYERWENMATKWKAVLPKRRLDASGSAEKGVAD